ncbi:MAG: hypothetical protein KA270_00980 [Saprospiraceae bacterium]|nr:hypothetical protein [Saprospiraceae bacterium]MBP6565703.1 hypothetical protein [Saprospiraceae bacterium]
MELQNKTKILNKVGISPIMTVLPSSTDFEHYVSHEYSNSIRKETDEAYRMFEWTLLHLSSGLRLTVTSHEDYFDNVTYKVISLYIILTNNENISILDVDFENKIFITASGEIPFKEVSFKIHR